MKKLSRYPIAQLPEEAWPPQLEASFVRWLERTPLLDPSVAERLRRPQPPPPPPSRPPPAPASDPAA